MDVNIIEHLYYEYMHRNFKEKWVIFFSFSGRIYELSKEFSNQSII